MSVFFKTISKYTLFAHSGEGVLRCGINLQLEGTTKWVTMLFYKPGMAVPNNIKTNKYYRLCYHFEDFPNIVDILRNETPLTFLFKEASKEGYIKTGAEPIGEEET